MRSTSATTDGLLPPVRIFVVLTGAEAAALGRWHGAGNVEAIRALDKIRTALERAIADAARPAPASAVPPLRAKHYQPRGTTSQVRPAEPLRMAKAVLKTKGPTASIDTAPGLDDYTPFRDEADGIYT